MWQTFGDKMSSNPSSLLQHQNWCREGTQGSSARPLTVMHGVLSGF